MKRTMACVALLLLAAGGARAQEDTPQVQPGDVIARVGDEVITAGDFARELQFRLRQFQATTGQTPQPDPRLRNIVMQELISERIVRIAARNAGVKITDEELEAEFQERRKAFRSDAAYESYLRQLNMSEADLRDHMRNGLAATRYLDGKAGELVATEEEIEEAYARLLDQGSMLRIEKTRDIGAILVRPEGDADEDWREAEDRAKAALERIRGGESFEVVAREVSDESASAERGGMLREMKFGSFYPELEEALDALEPGAVSEPVRNLMGWYLVTLVRVNEPGTIPLESVREGLEREIVQRKRKEVRDEIVKDHQNLIRIELVEAPGAQGGAPEAE
ncbi:MAG: SurA N-terminal domain-containing protein [Candidatus Hydrogenedentes bacterium]|nr:SurA N-terminal domain-containing protein [Candidatus Hydrogenedentota bacterium]